MQKVPDHAPCAFLFFCILLIFIDPKSHTFFHKQTNIIHINRQTRYIIYLHTHPTVPLLCFSFLLLNIILHVIQCSNNTRFYIHLIVLHLPHFILGASSSLFDIAIIVSSWWIILILELNTLIIEGSDLFCRQEYKYCSAIITVWLMNNSIVFARNGVLSLPLDYQSI